MAAIEKILVELEKKVEERDKQRREMLGEEEEAKEASGGEATKIESFQRIQSSYDEEENFGDRERRIMAVPEAKGEARSRSSSIISSSSILSSSSGCIQAQPHIVYVPAVEAQPQIARLIVREAHLEQEEVIEKLVPHRQLKAAVEEPGSKAKIFPISMPSKGLSITSGIPAASDASSKEEIDADAQSLIDQLRETVDSFKARSDQVATKIIDEDLGRIEEIFRENDEIVKSLKNSFQTGKVVVETELKSATDSTKKFHQRCASAVDENVGERLKRIEEITKEVEKGISEKMEARKEELEGWARKLVEGQVRMWEAEEAAKMARREAAERIQSIQDAVRE